MKKIILLLGLLISVNVNAIPIADTVEVHDMPTIVGYKEVTKTYNGWGGGPLHIFGHKHKHYSVPVYEFYEHEREHGPVASVPEPSTYAMLLVGMGLVAWRVKKG